MKRRLVGMVIGAAVGAAGGAGMLLYMHRNRGLPPTSTILGVAVVMAVIGAILGMISGVSSAV
jgi:hypothetical protein